MLLVIKIRMPSPPEVALLPLPLSVYSLLHDFVAFSVIFQFSRQATLLMVYTAVSSLINISFYQRMNSLIKGTLEIIIKRRILLLNRIEVYRRLHWHNIVDFLTVNRQISSKLSFATFLTQFPIIVCLQALMLRQTLNRG